MTEGTMRPRSVCVLTSAHQPLDVRIFQKQCRSLADAGWTVTLVVPGDEAGFVDGVEIVAIQRRAGRFQRFTRTTWAVYRTAKRIDADVFHFHDPDLLPVGLLLRAGGRSTIYDAHEDYPATILDKTWVPRPLRAPMAAGMRLMESAIARRMNAVVTVNDEIAARLKRSNPRTRIVRNYPILAEFNDEAGAARRDGEPTVLSLGGITNLRCASEIVDAVGLISPDREFSLLLGGIVESEELFVDLRTRRGWRRVDYRGVLTRSEMLQALRRASVSIVMFSPQLNHSRPGSNRLYESMAAGVPVVVPDFPKWRELVDRCECGIAVDPTDPRAIASAVEHLLTHPDEAVQMGRRGSDFALNHSWEAEAVELLTLYDEVATAGRIDQGPVIA